MIQRAKKRTLMLLGLAVSSFLGVISTHVRSNYSQEASLFFPIVHADVSAFGGGGGGDGCGGCSGDSGY